MAALGLLSLPPLFTAPTTGALQASEEENDVPHTHTRDRSLLVLLGKTFQLRHQRRASIDMFVHRLMTRSFHHHPGRAARPATAQQINLFING